MSDDRLDINLDDLTLGEVEDFEQASGITMDELGNGKVSAKALTALVWVVKRRADPDYKLEDARSIKVSDVALAEPNPTEGDS